VKRVFQIFSHTFAAATKAAGYEKELNTTTWQTTADFAERLRGSCTERRTLTPNSAFI